MADKNPKFYCKLASIALCVLFGGCATKTASKVSVEREKHRRANNVILVTISSLRADHLGCFGYGRDTSVNFDKFASENILFKNAFATSGWMMPACGSIFTSLYPKTHGVTHIDHRLADESVTLAEILGQNGFYCVGFCCNDRLASEQGFGQGFDIYDDYSVKVTLENLGMNTGNDGGFNKLRTNDMINDAAIGWLEKNTHAPFFMFVHYYDIHWDYLPPAPYDTLYDPDYTGSLDGTNIAREPLYSNRPPDEDFKHMIALYDGEIKQTDDELGRLLNYLKAKGLFENSLIIIAADHGEQFYEHGHTSHQGIYEELIRVPMAVSVPDGDFKPKVVKSLVSQVDIMPTVLDYLNIQPPSGCEGVSFKNVIEGKTASARDVIFAEYTGGAIENCFAVRSSRYKCYQSGNKPPFAYDLLNDPCEQNPIPAGQFTDEIKTLRGRLIEWMPK